METDAASNAAQPKSHRRWCQYSLRTLLIFVTLAGVGCAVGMWLFDVVNTSNWVGFTDLEIDFVVTDGATNQPIEGAMIAVQSRGGSYLESSENAFSLTTDHNGSAQRICHENMCSGTQSGLLRTDTFAVHLPMWIVQASAPGYASGQPIHLDSVEYARQVQRLGAGSSRLTVHIPLNKDSRRTTTAN